MTLVKRSTFLHFDFWCKGQRHQGTTEQTACDVPRTSKRTHVVTFRGRPLTSIRTATKRAAGSNSNLQFDSPRTAWTIVYPHALRRV